MNGKEFIKLIHDQAHNLNVDMIIEDEDIKCRIKPLVIALNKVTQEYRKKNAFITVLRCIIATDGQNVLELLKHMSIGNKERIKQLLTNSIVN